MTNPLGAWLDDLTLPELQERLEGDAVFVVPVFAATVPPPWLPIRTGAAIARAVAQRLVDRLPVIAMHEAPQQELTARAAALQALGARRFAVLDAGFSGPACAAAPAAAFVARVAAGSTDADDIDTSLMYALDPRSIRAGLLPPSSRASAFTGERAMADAVERIVAALLVRWPDLRA